MKEVLALILDDGHGTETPGKRSNITGMKENEFNNATMQEMIKLCELNSILHFEVAPTDKDTPLSERTTAANKWYKELVTKYGKENVICVYVAIHANAGGGTGVEVWAHSNANATTIALATKICAEIAELGLKNRGVKKGYPNAPKSNFAVNRDTDMTSVLIEHAFMDTKADAALLDSDKFRKDCAIADITAIMEYYGMGKPKTEVLKQLKRGYYRMGLFNEQTKEQSDVQNIVKLMKATGRAVDYVEVD